MKIIAVVCLLIGCVTLCACGGSSNNNHQPPSLTSIAVTPATSTLWVGLDPQQFTATGHYSDGTTQNLTSSATWSSSSTNVAQISAAGVATPLSEGSVSISATKSGAPAAPAST